MGNINVSIIINVGAGYCGKDPMQIAVEAESGFGGVAQREPSARGPL